MMNKQTRVILAALLAVAMVVGACRRDEPPVLKIGLIAGEGDFNDRGYSENIHTGFSAILKDFGMEGVALATASTQDIPGHIAYLLSKKFDLIITIGSMSAEATVQAAEANPDIDFILIDHTIENPPANLLCLVFDIHEAAYPCGFLAAYWADRKSPAIPMAGYVAGPDSPEIRQFLTPYARGVIQYNQRYGRGVLLSGHFATSFADTLQGAQLAGSLLEEGAAVLFAFAGRTGTGALYKVKEAGRWAIGVDVDQYYSIPEVGSTLLTSCVKMLNSTVYGVLKDYISGTFEGGRTLHNNLQSGGVRLAPFHDYSEAIPDSIKGAISEILEGIMDGTIETGWGGS
jgi:basic membrane protein A